MTFTYYLFSKCKIFDKTHQLLVNYANLFIVVLNTSTTSFKV